MRTRVSSYSEMEPKSAENKVGIGGSNIKQGGPIQHALVRAMKRQDAILRTLSLSQVNPETSRVS